MSKKKKLVRAAFRNAVFSRDNFSCAICGFRSSVELAELELDAHHITPREEMPNGGYVKENGISLCADCHIKAEDHLMGKTEDPLFSLPHLYEIISSSYDDAWRASNQLE